MNHASKIGSRKTIALGLTLVMALSWLGCGSPPAGSESRTPVDLIVRGEIVVTMDAAGHIYRPGFVAVSGNSIEAVGPAEETARYQASQTIEAPGGIVLPGLVNGHQHAPMALFRGLADDLDLMDWLNDYIFPAEKANVDPQFVYWGTVLAAVEMVQSGTTTYADMYYFEDEVAKGTSLVGMRGVLGQTIIGFPAPDYSTPEETLKATEGFLQRWRNHPLIVPAPAPHAPFTVPREILMASRRLADLYDVPLLIHVAETQAEVEQVRRETGFTPVRYLKEIGFLADRVTANHVVWADSEEIAMLKEFGVGVIHNPQSNMKLASGVAPVVEMLAAGVDVGLGTDGAASNNNLDMFEEMGTMAMLHKLARKDPTAVSARQVLHAATLGSARALSMGNRIGSLEAGKRADMILLDRRSASAWPLFDPYSAAVYALLGSSVHTVLVDGKLIYRNRRFANVQMAELLGRVEQQRKKVERSLER